MNPELAARLESLEAERLRPVPARPPVLPSPIQEAFRGVLDRLVQADAENDPGAPEDVEETP